MSLAEELDDIAQDVDDAVGALFDTVAQEYDDRAQLYQRLLDLRLPATFAIQLDKAQRVNSPPGTEAELERYLDYLGELLLDSERLDRAIATEDLLATAIAVVAVDASSGGLAVSLPTVTCTTLAPALARDLCDPGALEGYEASLGFEIRRFTAALRPMLRVSSTFGDVVAGQVLATLHEEAGQVFDTTMARIATLDPGTAYVGVQRILLDYFPAATAVWAGDGTDSTAMDPFLYPTIVVALDAERAAARQLLEVEYELIRATIPDTHIEEVLGIWFDPPPVVPR